MTAAKGHVDASQMHTSKFFFILLLLLFIVIHRLISQSGKDKISDLGVVLLLLTFCLLLLPLWESVIVLCFVVRNFMSILVLQSS